MKKRNKLISAVLCAVLCLSLFAPVPVRAETPVFTAVNDRVLELSADTMPIWVGNRMYIPYGSLDANTNGVRWGLYCSYSKADNLITVFDVDQRMFLEFDLREGSCYDGLTGEPYAPGAVLRGSRPYLPLDLICDYFDMDYSYREIEQGMLLRIRNADAVLSDPDFVDAAENVLDLRLREYNQPEGTIPAPAPSVPSAPTGGAGQEEKRIPTYLALRCEKEEDLGALLLTLENRKIHGVMFVTPELAQRRGDLILWMTGAGHTVGLLADGETFEQVRQQLEQGSRALEEQAFLRATVVYTRPEFREGLEQEGWVCWNGTLDLTPGDGDGPSLFARRTLARLEGRTRNTYLSLCGDANTLRILPTLLAKLEEAGFDPDIPLETRL